MAKFNFKKLFLLTASVMLITSTAACSSGEDGSSGNGGSDSSKTITIAFRNTSNEGLKKLLDKAEPAFEKSHPGVNVEVLPIQASPSDFFTKLALMMKSGETAPDVITEDTFMIQSDAAAGYLAPLTDMVQKWDGWNHFYDKVKNGVKASDGEVYAVPYTTDTRGLWYNVKAFKKAGISVPWHPKTWKDVKEAAQKLNKKAPNVIPYLGYSGKASGEATTMQHFEMLLYGTENSLYDFESGKWIVKSPGFLDSLKFIHYMFSKGLGPKLSTILNAQAGSIVQTKLAPEGKLGIWLDGNWLPGIWENNGFKKWDEMYNLTAMPTQNGQKPGATSMSGGWAFSVYKNSEHKDLAFEFITLLTNKKNNKYYSMVQGTLSPRKDVSKMPEYAKSGVNKKASSFLKFTHYRPAVANYPSVSSEIQKAVEAVASGRLTPKEAMERYAKNVKRIVGEKKVKTVK